jgi:hypothetical protein
VTRRNDSQTSLERTVSFMLLAIGSALPFIIAWVLIASTNDENPLDNIPDYEAPQEETLTIPFDRDTPVRTTFRYRGNVRLLIEGTGQAAGTAYTDAFYAYANADGTPLETPQLADSGLVINGTAALAALELADKPLPYNADHFYTAVYDVGFELHTITFQVADATPEDNTGAYTITVIDIDDPWDR